MHVCHVNALRSPSVLGLRPSVTLVSSSCVKALHLVQVLMYGACDTPGPAREDIATIIQVQTLLAPHSLLLQTYEHLPDSCCKFSSSCHKF